MINIPFFKMASPRCSVTDILNEHFGEDSDSLKSVENLYKEYVAKEKALSSSIQQSEKQTVEDLNGVIQSCDVMLKDIEETCGKIDIIVNTFKQHDKESNTMKEHLDSLKTEICSLENRQLYLSWKAKMDKLSADVASHIEKKNIQQAIQTHTSLYTICSRLHSTSCENLRNYAFDVCEQRYTELKDVLTRELDALLISIKYPFPTGISSPIFHKKEETEEHFKKTLSLLTKLRSLSKDVGTSLVSHLLAKSMVKRFRFHFYGDRHTNNKEKPEWYYTQVINWIRDHGQFFDDYIQPVVNKTLDTKSFVKMEINDLLVKLCEEKLVLTLNDVIENDILLAHYIDETLMFEKELQEFVHSTNGCLHVLLKDEFLEHWLALEKKFALDSMSDMMSHEEAWSPAYADLKLRKADDKNVLYFVPRCVGEFMTLLSLMTARHKTLNNTHAQHKFLNVLIINIHSFIIQMKDIASVEVIRPESQRYCSILNGVFYISNVLLEWTDDLYYLQLLENKRECNKDKIEGIFDDVVGSLDKFLDALICSIAEHVEDGLRTKIKTYKAERWHGLPLLKEYIIPILSSSACDMLLFIKQHLHMLEEKLCDDVFQKVWKKVANVIDRLIFMEVVFECHFNEGGANQLQFDITKNLFVVFGQYTPRPQAHFKLLKDSCTLLNLLPGSAVLLKEVLEQAEKTSKTEDEKERSVKTSLQDMGIKYLTVSQASRIIKARIDWPKI